MSKTSPWQTILRSKFTALPLVEGFTPDKLAEGCFADIGDALEKAVDDADAEKIFQDWLARYSHVKLDINPIDAQLIDAMCTGPSPITMRGSLVKRFGEASVLAALKSRGYASLTALKPTLEPEKKASDKKKDDDQSSNPWSDKCRFHNDPYGLKRREAQIKVISFAGAAAAVAFAKSAGKTLGGQPLRK